MNEENLKKVLYLIFKVTIENNGFLSQLEIFRDVRLLMNKYFNIKESDLIVKIGQGRSEDFKDVLNFILTILSELALVSQKMENKSFYFKWTGFKGFRKKYMLEFLSNNESNFEMSESFEHRIQIFTRMILLNLFKNSEHKITLDEIENLIKQCGLEFQQRQIEKVYWILKFIGFISTVNSEKNLHITPQVVNLPGSASSNPNQVFALLTNPLKGDTVIFKMNDLILDENLIKDNVVAEKMYVTFNEFILDQIHQWKEEISKYEKNEISSIQQDVKMEDGQEASNIKLETINSGMEKNLRDTQMLVDQDSSTGHHLTKAELSELENFKVNQIKFNSENEEIGFALLKGTNWCYYIKKLCCLIGRAPIKYGVPLNSLSANKNSNNKVAPPTENLGKTTWHVDVDLGQNRKISKQHALIAYNFQTCSWEIQNLSKKYPLKVNGEDIKYGEDMPLTSKTLINIGNQEFYFLLPL
jgi:hypothetical protein